MRLLPLCLCTLVLGATAATSATAGAWSKPAGGVYAKLGSSAFVSGHAYDNRGRRVDGDTFVLRAETLYAYAELGLTDDVTLVAFVPWAAATNQHESGVRFHTLGFGDATLGAQVPVATWGPLRVSARVDGKVPLYRGGPSVQGRQSAAVPGYGRSARYFPALGDGQVDMTSWVLGGMSLPAIDGFVGVEGGYRLRFGNITDAIVALSTLGTWLLPGRLLLLVNAQSVMSLPSEDELRVAVGKGYLAFGPACMVILGGGLTLELGYDVVTQGVNTAGGTQLQLGISYAQ
ncbi:MAG: hypothetical protein ACO3JL_14250 [Myxococcota bacterium]